MVASDSQKHIKASSGADCDNLSHYTTSYSVVHGKADFTPKAGLHSGTGYSANFRPSVYYKENLDYIDNPTILPAMRRAYLTSTKKDFTETKPSNNQSSAVHYTSSGFLTGIVNTLPRYQEVKDVHFDTRDNKTAKQQPLLYTFKRKDPTSMEYNNTGPRYMETEAKAKFKGLPNQLVNTEGKIVSHKQGSGFTANKNIEPITYRDDDSYVVKRSVRNVGESETKTSFLKQKQITGLEEQPDVRNTMSNYSLATTTRPKFYDPPNTQFFVKQSYVRDTDLPEVIVKRIQKSNPAEYANLKNPNNKTSLTKLDFTLGKKNDAKNLTFIGKKEVTGFLKNTDVWTVKPSNPRDAYISYYKHKHSNPLPKGKEREGCLNRNVIKHSLNGFTKSTAVHNFGRQVDDLKSIKNTYQSRSMVRRDNLLTDSKFLC